MKDSLDLRGTVRTRVREGIVERELLQFHHLSPRPCELRCIGISGMGCDNIMRLWRRRTDDIIDEAFRIFGLKQWRSCFSSSFLLSLSLSLPLTNTNSQSLTIATCYGAGQVPRERRKGHFFSHHFCIAHFLLEFRSLSDDVKRDQS